MYNINGSLIQLGRNINRAISIRDNYQKECLDKIVKGMNVNSETISMAKDCSDMLRCIIK